MITVKAMHGQALTLSNLSVYCLFSKTKNTDFPSKWISLAKLTPLNVFIENYEKHKLGFVTELIFEDNFRTHRLAILCKISAQSFTGVL